MSHGCERARQLEIEAIVRVEYLLTVHGNVSDTPRGRHRVPEMTPIPQSNQSRHKNKNTNNYSYIIL